MKGTSLLAKICAATLLLGGAAWAEDTSGLIDSSKLKDQKVTDLEGNELGKVDRLLVDPQSGRIRFAVIDVGNILDKQGAEIAVPWQTLKVNRESGGPGFTVQLNATKEKAQDAPRFSEAEADRLFTPSGSEPIETYWIIVPVPSDTENRQQAGTTSPNQPSNTGQPSPGSQPNVSTPNDEGNKPSSPGSYYQKNRPSTAPSSTEQNNSPAGAQQQQQILGNQEGVPPKAPESETKTPSAPELTSPDKSDTKTETPEFPGEPSTTP